MRARHSSHAGVSLAYLMGDFARLAYDWSGEENPTFLRLKEATRPHASPWSHFCFPLPCFSHIAKTCLLLTFKHFATRRVLVEVFWQGDEKLGSNIRCPRDGRPGCALVDWLSPEHRRLQTHFMQFDQQHMFAFVGVQGTFCLDVFRNLDMLYSAGLPLKSCLDCRCLFHRVLGFWSQQFSFPSCPCQI